MQESRAAVSESAELAVFPLPVKLLKCGQQLVKLCFKPHIYKLKEVDVLLRELHMNDPDTLLVCVGLCCSSCRHKWLRLAAGHAGGCVCPASRALSCVCGLGPTAWLSSTSSPLLTRGAVRPAAEGLQGETSAVQMCNTDVCGVLLILACTSKCQVLSNVLYSLDLFWQTHGSAF